MDKLIIELLSPFVRRLSRASLFLSALFWGTGLLLFHLFPAGFPRICPSGGADACGLFAAHPQHLIASALVIGALLAAAVLVFDQTAGITQLVSGARWPIRIPFQRFQEWRRYRMTKRGYGNRAKDRDAPEKRPNSNCRMRADLYPHGTTITCHTGSSKPHDVAIEPTMLGNVFAATRQRLLATHGLRLHSCWELLLELIPADARLRLAAASAMVMTRIQAAMWFAFSAVWAIWLPTGLWEAWLVMCLVGAYFAYRAACSAAAEYCARIRAVVVTYRTRLYDAAGFPRPRSTTDEPRLGQTLSAFLDGHGRLDYRALIWPTGDRT